MEGCDALRAWMRASGSEAKRWTKEGAYAELEASIRASKGDPSVCLAWLPVRDGASKHPRTRTVATDALYDVEARRRMAAASVLEATFEAGGKRAFFSALCELSSERASERRHGTTASTMDEKVVMKNACLSEETLIEASKKGRYKEVGMASMRGSNGSRSAWNQLTSTSGKLGAMLVEMHVVASVALQHEAMEDVLLSHARWIQAMIRASPYVRLPMDVLDDCIGALLARLRKDDLPVHVACGLLGCLEAAARATIGLVDFEQGMGEAGGLETLLELSTSGNSSATACSAVQALQAFCACCPTLAHERLDCLLSIVNRSLQTGDGSPAHDKFANEALKTLVELSKASSLQLDGSPMPSTSFDVTENYEATRNFERMSLTQKSVRSSPGTDLPVRIGIDSQLRLWESMVVDTLPLALDHPAPMVRTSAMVVISSLSELVFESLKLEHRMFLLDAVVSKLNSNEQTGIRAAACRAMGVLLTFPSNFRLQLRCIECLFPQLEEEQISVRISASWALANFCNVLHVHHKESPLRSDTELLAGLANALVTAARGNDKVRANVVRGMGYLLAFYGQIHVDEDALPAWLPYCFDALLSAVTTGNVKVQWNGCYALGTVLGCSRLLKALPYAVPSAARVLMLLVRDCANFKIRVHAASALSVPQSRRDFAETYPDVLLVLTTALETIDGHEGRGPVFLGNSYQETTYADLKYKPVLRGQLLLTLLHIVSLGTPEDIKLAHDTLVRKADMLKKLIELAYFLVPNTSSDREDETGTCHRTAGVLQHAYSFPDNGLTLSGVNAATEGLMRMYSGGGALQNQQVLYYERLFARSST